MPPAKYCYHPFNNNIIQTHCAVIFCPLLCNRPEEMTTLAPVVTSLTVRNHLQSSFQVGGTLYLDGYGSARPDLEQALIVDTGAGFSGPVLVGAMDVTGDANIAGLLEATLYGPIAAATLNVAGTITAVAAATDLFAAEFYVAPIGDDLYGNGSATNPFQTIAKAVAAAMADASASPTIVLRTGTYAENVLLQTYINIDALSATITGSVTIAIDSAPGGTIAVRGVTINGPVNVQGSVPYSIAFTACNMYLEGVDGPALSIGGGSSITAGIDNCSINTTFAGQLSLPSLVVSTGNVTILNSNINVTADTVSSIYNAVSIAAGGSMHASAVRLYSGSITDPSTTLCLVNISATFTITACMFATQVLGLSIPILSSCGIRVTGSHTLTAMKNIFANNTAKLLPPTYAVDNSDPGSTVITQGNVSYPSSFAGYSVPVAQLATF